MKETKFFIDEDNDVVNVEMSKEDIEKANKKYQNLILKKNILYASMLVFVVSIVLFGMYKTFFQRNYTGQEIAALANAYNKKTNFPESVVQGYLESNINILLKDKLNLRQDINEVEIQKPVVTRINAKNDNLANIYFYTIIKANTGDVKVNCVLPLYWDSKTQECEPAGQIMITPNKSSASNTNERENELLSFKDIQKDTDENINSSKTFVDNFFTMLYAGQDVSPYYKGRTEIESSDLKYDGITEYVLYQKTNKNGYNATCKINLIMPNGISYTTQKYLTIERSGESWIVSAIL